MRGELVRIALTPSGRDNTVFHATEEGCSRPGPALASDPICARSMRVARSECAVTRLSATKLVSMRLGGECSRSVACADSDPICARKLRVARSGDRYADPEVKYLSRVAHQSLCEEAP